MVFTAAGIILALGWVGGWLMGQAKRCRWTQEAFHQLCLFSLAVVAWYVADKIVGGNGFIAAFVAGLVVKIGFEDARERMGEFSAAWGQLLNHGPSQRVGAWDHRRPGNRPVRPAGGGDGRRRA